MARYGFPVVEQVEIEDEMVDVINVGSATPRSEPDIDMVGSFVRFAVGCFCFGLALLAVAGALRLIGIHL